MAGYIRKVGKGKNGRVHTYFMLFGLARRKIWHQLSTRGIGYRREKNVFGQRNRNLLGQHMKEARTRRKIINSSRYIPHLRYQS